VSKHRAAIAGVGLAAMVGGGLITRAVRARA
jgi:hypothetical protein